MQGVWAREDARIMRKLIVLSVLCVSVGAIWLVLHGDQSGRVDIPANGADKTVPVFVAVVTQLDAPISITTIGTVQAFNSVLVRTRVDGQLERVAFVEGQQVKKGDLLAQIDRRPAETQLQAALAQKVKDAAQLANTERDLARFAQLSYRGAVPTQMLDTTRAQADQFKAALDVDNAQVENARIQLDYTTIRAPLDGRTGARLVDAGNMVHATDSGGLVLIAQIHPITISFTVPQDVLPTLQAQQQKAPLKVTALSRDASRHLGEGVLTLIDNQIDSSTGTIRCKATFDNRDDLLWPGQFVSLGVVLDTRRDSLTVPATAVQLGSEGPYIFVVKDNVISELRNVEVVSTDRGRSVIARGVSAGEQVVVEGQYKLESGAHVRVIERAAGTP